MTFSIISRGFRGHGGLPKPATLGSRIGIEPGTINVASRWAYPKYSGLVSINSGEGSLSKDGITWVTSITLTANERFKVKVTASDAYFTEVQLVLNTGDVFSVTSKPEPPAIVYGADWGVDDEWNYDTPFYQ